MRKTIYVPSQEVWDEVKRKADEAGITVSKYLLGSTNHVPNSQLDRIEKKLDSIISYHKVSETLNDKTNRLIGDDAVSEKPFSIRKKKIKGGKPSDNIAYADILKAKEMLKEKMELIARKKPESLTGWVGGFSKAQQVGKEGGKK